MKRHINKQIFEVDQRKLLKDYVLIYAECPLNIIVTIKSKSKFWHLLLYTECKVCTSKSIVYTNKMFG